MDLGLTNRQRQIADLLLEFDGIRFHHLSRRHPGPSYRALFNLNAALSDENCTELIREEFRELLSGYMWTYERTAVMASTNNAVADIVETLNDRQENRITIPMNNDSRFRGGVSGRPLSAGNQVLLIDDGVSSYDTINTAIAALESNGYDIARVVGLIDPCDGTYYGLRHAHYQVSPVMSLRNILKHYRSSRQISDYLYDELTAGME